MCGFDRRQRRIISFPRFSMQDDQTPATKADIVRLEQSLTAVGSKLESINRAIDQVLTVLVNVDKRLTNAVDDHEWRLRRLENRVGVSAT